MPINQTSVWNGSQWVTMGGVVDTASNYNWAGSHNFAQSAIFQDDVRVKSLNGGQLAGFRNKIINGAFDINQRALSSSGTSSNYAFGFDRWQFEYNGGTTTMSAQAFTPGNAITGYEPTNYLRIVTTGQTDAGHYSILEYPIEDARTLAGQQVTISFWAKAASGTPKIGFGGYQQFPGGNGYTNLPTNTVTIGTTWNRYSITFTMPSVSGKTITAGSFTRLYFLTSAGSSASALGGVVGVQNNTFDFWGFQLEAGPYATPFEHRPVGTELALCQRYFQSSFPYGTAPANNISPGMIFVQVPGNGMTNGVPFQVPMRATPSITTYNPFANNSNWRIAFSATDVTAQVSVLGNYGIYTITTGSPDTTVARAIHGNWVATAEL